jgi:signal transduction histidine kinase
MSAIASPTTNRLLIGGWAAAAALLAALMWLEPGKETVPFHFIWIGLALVYGFTRWPLGAMVSSLLLVTAVTGVILGHHAAEGVIPWEETTEVPLMMAVFGVMVWHVSRRNQALLEVRRLADAENRRLEVQQLFLRLASHEMRTPITVARGYTELVRTAHPDPVTREDTDVVLDELDKLAGITQRIVTLMQLEEPYRLAPACLDDHLERIAHRWRPAADRDWSVRSQIGTVLVNAERLEAAIDTLVENAIRATAPGDRIELIGSSDPNGWQVAVADTGTGMPEDQVADLIAGRSARNMGTGLGMAIVRSVAATLGGEVRISSRPGQGTTVAITVPADGPPKPGPAVEEEYLKS